MAFRRTVPVFGKHMERADVSQHMRKWWNLNFTKNEGVVEQHISPYEQNIMGSLFNNAPAKIAKITSKWAYQGGIPFVLFWSVKWWADENYADRHKAHWD